MTAATNILIVGASLAGLRTAEALRGQGYKGHLALIGDERDPPYDRPPLSKQVLSGWVAPDQTRLPRLRPINASWHLGTAAIALDRAARTVTTADGKILAYDRLVVATGARSRRWPIAEEDALKGVFVLRTRQDAEGLVAALDARPKRVLIVGAGFTGSEIASACCDREIRVTVVEINKTPLQAAVGAVLGGFFADLQVAAGVDLRCEVAVSRLRGDASGQVTGAQLSDGSFIEADLVVICLGATRNVEWLDGAGLDASPAGLVCDEYCRALDGSGRPAEDIFAAGDVARFRHPLSDDKLISLEHWSGAVDQARIVAANILAPGSASTRDTLPRFWSMQFGIGLKASGLPSCAEEMAIVQGSLANGRFVAAFGRNGKVVGIVAANQARWLNFYEQQIVTGGTFPPDYRVVDMPADLTPKPAGFPSIVEEVVPA